MADTSNLSTFLGDIANAIRTKKETTEPIAAADFDTEILGIKGGIDASDATATAADIIAPKTAYTSAGKVVGTLQSIEDEIPGEPRINTIGPLSTVSKTDVSLDGKFCVRAGTKEFYVYRMANGRQGTQVMSVGGIGSYNNVQISDIGVGCANYYNEASGEYIRYVCIVTSNPDDRYGRGLYALRFDKDDNYLGYYVNYTDPSEAGFGYGGAVFPHPTKPNMFGCVWSLRNGQIRIAIIVGGDGNSLQQYGNWYTGSGQLYGSLDYTPVLGYWAQSTDELYLFGNQNPAQGWKVEITWTDDNAVYQVLKTDFTPIDNVFNSYTKSYVLVNGKLYDRAENTLIYDFSDKVSKYSYLYEIENNLYIYTVKDSQLISYAVSDGECVELSNYGTCTLDTAPTTHHRFDGCKYTLTMTTSSRMIFVTSELLSRYSQLIYNGVPFYNIDDGNAVATNLLVGKTAYTSDGKITGSMVNNGAKTYTPGDEEVNIDTGYHNGSKVSAVDITTLDNYRSCVRIANDILGLDIPYTELQYVKGTGTQYINTGYTPNANTKVEVKVNAVVTSTKHWEVLFGSRPSYQNSDFSFATSYQNGAKMVLGYGTNVELSGTYPASGKDAVITLDKGKLTISVDGENIYTYTKTGTFTSAIPMYLMSWISESATYSKEGTAQSNTKLYYCKIWDDDQLVRNYIPVKDELGVGALYDLVQSKLCYSESDDDFVVGGEV